MNKEEFIENLILVTKENLNAAQTFIEASDIQLSHKVNDEKWSVLECLEHLNRYTDYYHDEIKNRMGSTSAAKNSSVKSSWIGKKFVKSLQLIEKEGTQSVKSMNAPTSANPTKTKSKIDRTVLSKFISSQKELLEILNEARSLDLEKTKTSISISRLIKLRLCDTFRVIVFHNERHIWQAVNALNNAKRN